MNPVYVVLGGLFWKTWGKTIGLWYVHRAVNMKLRTAAYFADFIVTASSESFQLKSPKVNVIGHGIDTGAYSKLVHSVKKPTDAVSLLQVGRITRIKNCDILISAAALLRTSWNREFKVTFIGEPVTADDLIYKKELEEMLAHESLQGIVEFVGSVPSSQMPERYRSADASVNLAPTGGVDKAVLESLAAGTPAFFSNEAFLGLFGSYTDKFRVPLRDSAALAGKVRDHFGRSAEPDVIKMLRDRVLDGYGVAGLVSRIISLYHDASR